MKIGRPVSQDIPSPTRPALDREVLDAKPLIDSIVSEFASLAPRLDYKDLVGWVGLRVQNEPAIRRMFFGTIEWPRAGGRPDRPTMSEALAVVHAWPDAFQESQQGDAFAWRLIDVPYPVQPTLVDGPSDERTWRVSYVGVIGTKPIEHSMQQLRIRGIDGVPWVTPNGQPVQKVRPAPIMITLDRANPVTFLPPFLLSLS